MHTGPDPSHGTAGLMVRKPRTCNWEQIRSETMTERDCDYMVNLNLNNLNVCFSKYFMLYFGPFVY